MKLLKLAIEKQRWDLAAHTIVLAAARTLNKGDRPYVSQNKPKNKRIKGKPLLSSNLSTLNDTSKKTR